MLIDLKEKQLYITTMLSPKEYPTKYSYFKSGLIDAKKKLNEGNYDCVVDMLYEGEKGVQPGESLLEFYELCGGDLTKIDYGYIEYEYYNFIKKLEKNINLTVSKWHNLNGYELFVKFDLNKFCNPPIPSIWIYMKKSEREIYE